MSHDIFQYESLLKMSHDLTSFHVSHATHKWVPGYMKMSLVTLTNESYHTYKWVLSHIHMRLITHTHESCHTYTWVLSHSQRIHRNEPCRTTSHVTRGNGQEQVTKTRGKGSQGVIPTCHSESHPPKKLRGSRVSIPCTPFCLICTISSKLTCISDLHPFEWAGVDFRWFSVDGFDAHWIPRSVSCG